MIWSGWLIYWANDVYIPIPDSVARAVGLNNRLAEGMNWHFFLMWPFMINGIAFLVYAAASGEWRELVPDRKSFSEAWQVLLHDLKLRKSAPALRGKFNGAQRIAYTGAILLSGFAVMTGLAIYKPVQLGWLAAALGGYETARAFHFVAMLLLVLFFIVHVVQVARAGWNNLRGMIAGYEIVEPSTTRKLDPAGPTPAGSSADQLTKNPTWQPEEIE